MLKSKIVAITAAAVLGLAIIALPSAAATSAEKNAEDSKNIWNYMTDYMSRGQMPDYSTMLDMHNSPEMQEIHNSPQMQEMHNSPEMWEAMEDGNFDKMQEFMDSYQATGGVTCH